MSCLTFSAVCDKGKVRGENQDAIFIQGFDKSCISESVRLSDSVELNNPEKLAVFDGIGGEENGEIASEIARNIFSRSCGTDISLEDICLMINWKICDYTEESGSFRMGSTAAMVEIDGKVQYCNIGDSKIYKISDSGIEQLSVDHIAVIGKYNRRRVLTQHLGIPEKEILIEPYSGETAYGDNDIFIICSDGLTDMVDESEILGISLNSDIENLAERLFDEAMRLGGRDNISIIAFRITG